MRDLLLRAPVNVRRLLAACAAFVLCGLTVVALPDDWPMWVYLLTGALFALVASFVGALWERMGGRDA